MNTLLIGGTNDGERFEIPDDNQHIELKYKAPLRHYLEKALAYETVPTEQYSRARIGGSTKTFEVFAIQGMTGDQIIERLIERYR